LRLVKGILGQSPLIAKVLSKLLRSSERKVRGRPRYTTFPFIEASLGESGYSLVATAKKMEAQISRAGRPGSKRCMSDFAKTAAAGGEGEHPLGTLGKLVHLVGPAVEKVAI
jgi:hypothetical protein